MTDRLLSAPHAAEAIAHGLDVGTFKRLADRHGIPYHKLGRERYYSVDAIALLIERTRRCPDVGEGHISIGVETAGSSAGQKADARASVEQALQIARKLRDNSRTSSRRGAARATHRATS